MHSLPLIVISMLAAGPGAPECGLHFSASLQEWSALGTNASLQVTFDEPSWPVNQFLTGLWTLNGFGFQGFAGTPQPNIFVADFGSPFGTGQWLTANGDELIDITPPAGTSALAFDAASNQFGGASISVFDGGGALLGALEIPINTVSFVGMTCSVPIARVRFASTLGAIANTGFDNIRIMDYASPISADLNGDGTVNGADLGLLLGAWGSGPSIADLNCDGTVDGADLGALLGAWSVPG